MVTNAVSSGVKFLHGAVLDQAQAPSHQLQRMFMGAPPGMATSPEDVSVGSPGKKNPARLSVWQQSSENPPIHLHTKAGRRLGSWAAAQGVLHICATHENLFPAS